MCLYILWHGFVLSHVFDVTYNRWICTSMYRLMRSFIYTRWAFFFKWVSWNPCIFRLSFLTFRCSVVLLLGPCCKLNSLNILLQSLKCINYHSGLWRSWLLSGYVFNSVVQSDETVTTLDFSDFPSNCRDTWQNLTTGWIDRKNDLHLLFFSFER